MMAIRRWEKATVPWMASSTVSAAFALLTVILDLIHETYRHSIGDRIYGDIVIWLVGACVVRLMIFVVGRVDRRHKSL